jgi:hypothetical protein
MLALHFSIHIKMKLKGKCPKHPRFNPEIGQGAIRGGCRECLALCQVVAARIKLPRLCGDLSSSPSHTDCSRNRAMARAERGERCS